jgi:N-acetyl-gamma-glutamyl-phosphate reductase
VFSAMPHKASAEAIIPLMKRNIKIIDISADFRLKNADQYQAWYDFIHPAPKLLKEAVYGMPEFYRTQIKQAKLVANPGCYPTAALLALAPLVKNGLIYPDIIVDSKSGVSGAGRTLNLTSHYCEATDNVSAYALKGHRHLPEIVQELKLLNPNLAPSVSFVPHLVPMTRGILSTCYTKLKESKSSQGKEHKDIPDLFHEFYKKEPFVRVVNQPPSTKQTWGSNLCLIYPAFDIRTGRVIVISCIDNLVKGAAGQAIQNMNIMCGFPEKTGLDLMSVYP